MIIYNKLWIFYHIESIKIIITELFRKYHYKFKKYKHLLKGIIIAR